MGPIYMDGGMKRMRRIREGIGVIDNVIVTLTDINTGEEQVFSTHNIELNYALSALSQWMAGKNNVGFQPVYPPSTCSLGNGTGVPAKTDTALFAAIAGSTVSMSYASPDTPASGTTTFVFQYPPGQVTVLIKEALMKDVNGNGWFHTNFPSPFTPSSTQTITIQWQVTFG
jgi:hypothetical protein